LIRNITRILPSANKETIDYVVQLLSEIQRNFHTTEANLFPGVKNTLENLYNQGYELYIASNGPAGYAPRILKEYEIS
jgi:phosphoglycolate phosphatase-like HAD superfamily hydrolase